MIIHESYHSQLTTQAAAISTLPLWYPFFARSLYQRAQILASKSPGDLSHTPFFLKRGNYFRGLTANLSMQPLFPITDWLLGKALKQIEEVNQRKASHVEQLLAGFAAGSASVILANPYEVTVIASQKYVESPRLARGRVWQLSGFRGFYRGGVPMAVRNGAMMSCLLVAPPILEKPIGASLANAGILGGCAATLFASILPAALYTAAAVPLDFMAIMRQSDPAGKAYASAFEALGAAYRKHGLAAFKAGLGCRLIACIAEISSFHLFNDFYARRMPIHREGCSTR